MGCPSIERRKGVRRGRAVSVCVPALPTGPVVQPVVLDCWMCSSLHRHGPLRSIARKVPMLHLLLPRRRGASVVTKPLVQAVLFPGRCHAGSMMLLPYLAVHLLNGPPFVLRTS